MSSIARTIGRGIVVTVGAIVAAVVGWLLFLRIPGSLEGLLGVVLLLVTVALGARIASKLGAAILGDYDVAEVEVDDIITRDGGGPGPLAGVGASADEIVEQIEQADEDRNAEALIVKLNTPGGAVVPSEDIRTAAEEFDGPTVAYAEDMATSGGFWIASGCDHFHAREGALVGSIGVNGTHLGATELADKAGLDYRRFIAGDYKDTPATWRDLEDDEVEYFQGLLDDYYEQFVDTVVEGRDLEESFVRDTEARIYMGSAAHENGLVDACGPRQEMEDYVADELGVDEIEVEQFEPEAGLSEKIGMGAQRVAYALGAGVAETLRGDRDPPVRVR